MRDNIESGEIHEDGYSPEENYHLINFVQKYMKHASRHNDMYFM